MAHPKCDGLNRLCMGFPPETFQNGTKVIDGGQLGGYDFGKGTKLAISGVRAWVDPRCADS